MKFNHLLIPYIAVLVFIFGSVVGGGGVAWYKTLILPAFAPGDGLTAFVWAVIYVCASLSILTLWNKTPHDKRFNTIVSVFLLAGAVNLIWSVLFFSFHMLDMSAITALILLAVLILAEILVYPRSKEAALFLMPFVVWVLFATYFMYTLRALNVS